MSTSILDAGKDDDAMSTPRLETGERTPPELHEVQVVPKLPVALGKLAGSPSSPRAARSTSTTINDYNANNNYEPPPRLSSLEETLTQTNRLLSSTAFQFGTLLDDQEVKKSLRNSLAIGLGTSRGCMEKLQQSHPEFLRRKSERRVKERQHMITKIVKNGISDTNALVEAKEAFKEMKYYQDLPRKLAIRRAMRKGLSLEETNAILGQLGFKKVVGRLDAGASLAFYNDFDVMSASSLLTGGSRTDTKNTTLSKRLSFLDEVEGDTTILGGIDEEDVFTSEGVFSTTNSGGAGEASSSLSRGRGPRSAGSTTSTSAATSKRDPLSTLPNPSIPQPTKEEVASKQIVGVLTDTIERGKREITDLLQKIDIARNEEHRLEEQKVERMKLEEEILQQRLELQELQQLQRIQLEKMTSKGTSGGHGHQHGHAAPGERDRGSRNHHYHHHGHDHQHDYEHGHNKHYEYDLHNSGAPGPRPFSSQSRKIDQERRKELQKQKELFEEKETQRLLKKQLEEELDQREQTLRAKEQEAEEKFQETHEIAYHEQEKELLQQELNDQRSFFEEKLVKIEQQIRKEKKKVVEAERQAAVEEERMAGASRDTDSYRERKGRHDQHQGRSIKHRSGAGDESLAMVKLLEMTYEKLYQRMQNKGKVKMSLSAAGRGANRKSSGRGGDRRDGSNSKSDRIRKDHYAEDSDEDENLFSSPTNINPFLVR
ncbi:unnamed protein product [Amoebophrya sp. A120]|nr:unnamed protein product [Amoebophrya sp. A120]|eukprot:GSA120T00007241001.1